MSIRGLPDERPRPSVANLIGRFEQRASKRQSLVGAGASPTASASPSRSTSVVSQNMGDAAQIEAKERREWPPKQAQSTTVETNSINLDDLRKSPSQTAVSKLERSGLVSPPSDAQSDAPSPLSASVESIAKSAPEPATDSNAQSDSELVPELDKTDKVKEMQTIPARAQGKITASKSTPTSTISASRTTTAGRGTTLRPSPAPQAKSSPSTPNKTSTSTAKPLSAQRTGSSTGTGAASRPGAKSPLASNARAKTPNAPRASTSCIASKANMARAKTPTASPAAAARSKTPTAGAARPKTPSGLFAPTKASLARARNADPPPPPAHKPTVSTSSLERLMKPTAASASKVRDSPVSPPRAPPVKSARGAAPTRGATVKPRVGLAPARMKAGREKKGKEEEAVKRAKTVVTAGAVSTAATMSGDEAPEQSTTSEHALSGDEDIEQPSLAPSVVSEGESHSYSEHEQPEAPSDIESYDDAFASDDDGRELDSAHIVSALPREEGEMAPFAMTPDNEQGPGFAEGGPALEVKEDEHVQEHEDEHVEEEAKEDLEPHVSENETTVDTVESAPESVEVVELEIKQETIANGAATPTPTTAKHNGFSSSSVPDTEFDNVLDILQVKPPARAVSLEEIPDDE